MKTRFGRILILGCLSILLMLQVGGHSFVLAREGQIGIDNEVKCVNHPEYDEGCCNRNDEVANSCEHSCELCNVKDSGIAPSLTLPTSHLLNNVSRTPSDVTKILKNLNFTVTQNGKGITSSDTLNNKDMILVTVSFDVPVDGDVTDSSTNDDAVHQNDYATFELAGGLSMVEIKDKELVFGNDKVGTLNVTYNPTGTVTVNGKEVQGVSTAKVDFTELVDDKSISNVSVKFAAEMYYNGNGDAGIEGNHEVSILGKNYTVVVPEKETTIKVEKNGVANLKDEVIDWKVKVEAKLGESDKGKLTDCIFEDNLKNVGEYVQNSFKIGDSESTVALPSAGLDYNDSTKILSYKFDDLDADTKYITFQTKIPESDGKQTINNTATVKTNRSNVKITEGKANVEYEMKWIEKSGTAGWKPGNGDYDPGNQTITWSIMANHKGKELKNVMITDVIDKEFDVTSAKWQEWTGSAWGNENTLTATDGQYKIGDINNKILLTITVKYKDASLPDAVKIVDNTATITWDGNPTGYAASGKVGIGFAPISKSGKVFNASEHTVEWEVNVNTQKQNYGPGLRVLDLLVYGDSGFSASSYDTIEGNTGSNLFKVDAEDIKNLEPSYNQKYVENSFNTASDLGIRVYTLKKEGKAVADLLVVTSNDGTTGIDKDKENSFKYKSVITNPTLYASNKKYNIVNSASLFSESNPVSKAVATQKCVSKMIEKDLLTRESGAKLESDEKNVEVANNKGGAANSFHYIDKTIYFRIHVNANGLTNATSDITTIDKATLGNLNVEDELPKGWEFKQIAGKDFLLFEGTGDVQQNGVVTASSAVDIPSTIIHKITSPTDEIGGKINLTFTALEKPYLLVVKAGPTSETASTFFSKNQDKISIRNNVNIKSDSGELANDYEDAELTSKLISKSLDSTNAEKEGYLKWTVDYNPYNLEHKDAYIEDILPHGIDLRTDSKGKLIIKDNISVSTLKLKPDGSYEQETDLSEETLTNLIRYNSQTRELRFQIPNTDKAYRLSYITDVTSTTGIAENKVTLKGGQNMPSGVSDKKSYSITNASSDATFKRSGWLLVMKLDADGNPLPGAEFTLYAEDGRTIIRKGVSDNDGKIYLKVIPEGDYILKESSAPIGYILDSKQHDVSIVKDSKGKFIASIDRQVGTSSHEITVKNHKTGTVGGLKIEKKVSGNAGDTTKAFDFILTLSDTVNTYAYIGNGVSDGQIKSGDTVSLSHNQSITLFELPKDITYSISEKDYSGDGYAVSMTGESGVIVSDYTQTASFTNTKNRSGGGSTSDGKVPDDKPTENPIEPQPPVVKPIYPTFTLHNVPNPNLFDTPEVISIVDKDNNVMGIYKKTKLEDGTFVYINEEGSILGKLEELPDPSVPYTGNDIPITLLCGLFISSLCGAFMLMVYKKHYLK